MSVLTALDALPRRRAPLHRPLLYFAAANAVLAVVAVVGMLVDDRVIAGSAAWFKPAKFAVSFVLYSLALAWLIALRPKASRLVWWMATVIVIAGTIEQVIIVGQVVRGLRSHFNTTTPLDTALWITMGVTIIVLFVATLVIGVQLAVTRIGDLAISWSIRLGVAITLAGLSLGQLMTRRDSGVEGIIGAHTVGAPDGTPGMPLTGWSTTDGDLRIPHFFGMHALQALPLLAALLVVLAPRVPLLRSLRVRLGLILTASGGYAATLALLTWQALRGQPLLHPDRATVTVAAAIVTGVVVGVMISVASATAVRKEVTV
ncbi:hypothetical protein BOX37_09730 [Nocardia mangyaensis]|uniref:Uncharacterized protein n=1 Tax=Nocardia mangyaensis TaxID=2213200 RepID=A0A1J0VQA8_9NOCA|nr:hypothetical protein [Nocardia mangyaensis]APE34194.1 hypothetical protein BOX37_09730 [Nocardia mangyaensis]